MKGLQNKRTIHKAKAQGYSFDKKLRNNEFS